MTACSATWLVTSIGAITKFVIDVPIFDFLAVLPEAFPVAEVRRWILSDIIWSNASPKPRVGCGLANQQRKASNHDARHAGHDLKYHGELRSRRRGQQLALWYLHHGFMH
jgi:hypothetical protein